MSVTAPWNAKVKNAYSRARTTTESMTALPGVSRAFSVSSLTMMPVSQPLNMYTAMREAAMKPLTPPSELHENQLTENGTEPAWCPNTATRQNTARIVMPMYSMAIRTHWTHAATRMPMYATTVTATTAAEPMIASPRRLCALPNSEIRYGPIGRQIEITPTK